MSYMHLTVVLAWIITALLLYKSHWGDLGSGRDWRSMEALDKLAYIICIAAFVKASSFLILLTYMGITS